MNFTTPGALFQCAERMGLLMPQFLIGEVQGGEKTLHPMVVRSLPVYARACRTLPELTAAAYDRWGNLAGNAFCDDLPEAFVALKASAKWPDRPMQVQTAQNLLNLSPGLHCADEEAVGQSAVLEQCPIMCKQNSPLAAGNLHQLRILFAARIQGVKTQKAQVCCKPSKMHVGYKPGFPQRFRSKTRLRCDIQRLEGGVDADVVAILHELCKIDRLAIDENHVHLGVGNAQVFDETFCGPATAKIMRKSAHPSFARKKIVQFRIKPKACLFFQHPMIEARPGPLWRGQCWMIPAKPQCRLCSYGSFECEWTLRLLNVLYPILS